MYHLFTAGLLALSAAGSVLADSSSSGSFSGTTVTAGIIYTPHVSATTVSSDGSAISTITVMQSSVTAASGLSSAASVASSSASSEASVASSTASASSHNAAATPNAGSLAGVIALGVMVVAL